MITKRNIRALRQVKQAIREPYAWPGGYPLYAITSDGAALSIDAVKENYRSVAYDTLNGLDSGWRVMAIDINWEDSDLVCDHSGKPIESAYGESDGSAPL